MAVEKIGRKELDALFVKNKKVAQKLNETIDAVNGVTDVSNFVVGFIPSTAQNNITAGTGGAISVANYLTTINTDAGGDAFTLADGTLVGQMKKILLVADGGGNAVITTTLSTGNNTITMNDAADFVILQWSADGWIVIENSGSTVSTV